MPAIDDLSAFADADERTLHVVVETPRGSRAKYKYEPKLGLFTLHKALALGFCYPFAIGFVPGTRAADGDPLDVLLVTTLEPPTGCLVVCQLLGVIEAEQREGDAAPVRNDRLLAVPALEHDDRQLPNLDALGARELTEIERFFVDSGKLYGKQLRIIDCQGAERALALIRKALSK